MRTRDFEPVGNGMKVEVPITPVMRPTNRNPQLPWTCPRCCGQRLQSAVAGAICDAQSTGSSSTRRTEAWDIKPDYVFNSTITRHNARRQLLGMAGATQERTLFPVSCTPLLGCTAREPAPYGDHADVTDGAPLGKLDYRFLGRHAGKISLSFFQLLTGYRWPCVRITHRHHNFINIAES